MVLHTKYHTVVFTFVISGKGENFQPDHAALLSILRNEGISSAGVAPVTPKSKPYNYLVSLQIVV